MENTREKDNRKKACELEGAGVVELVLILVVLISLVIIFKSQLTALLNLIFEQIQSSAGSVF